MKLQKLKKMLAESEKFRNQWKIRWKVWVQTDDEDYIFSLLPTILWQPWVVRAHNATVVTITWLNLHICIGRWERREVL